MTTTTIIGATKGAPDNSQETLLHIYDQTLATGARAAQGDGTGLGLVVWENEIGVENASGFHSKISTGATANRAVALPDAAGTIVLGNGAGITDTAAFRAGAGIDHVTLAADFTNSTLVQSAVTGMNLPLEVNSVYEIKAVLRYKTAATTTGMVPQITGPASSLNYLTATARRRAQDFTVADFNTDVVFTGSSAADTPEIMMIEGIVAINGTSPASDLGLSIRSEVDTSLVTLLEGSTLTLTKV